MVYQPPPKVPTYHDLLGELQKVRGENRDLREFNRNINTRVAELEAAILKHKLLYIYSSPDFEDLELWKTIEP